MFDPESVPPPGAKIKVIGVGGGGGNAVNTMIRCGLDGVDFVTCNTDVQALRFSLASHKLQIGRELTRGLGAGADPDIGRDAALEDRHEIQDILAGADMVFITAGMGGGTGTGGASVVAQIARELGALTVAVVTKPFTFEGKRRRKHADIGISRLRECVDTLITIPNQRLLQVASPDLSMIDAFKMADEVLVNAVRGISDIINIPGMVNVDFADVKTVMSCMGQALMGVGSGIGQNRAVEAARQAICSPLLEDIDIEGATGILVNITAGPGVTLHEINEACGVIQEAAHEDANFIFGTVIDETLGDAIRVTVIATGFPVDKEEQEGEAKPQSQIVTPYAARITSPGLITTPKAVARPSTSPQHYAPLTTRKPEPAKAAPVSTPVAPTAPAAPAVKAPEPQMHAAAPAQPAQPTQYTQPAQPAREPLVQHRQEPLVEIPRIDADISLATPQIATLTPAAMAAPVVAAPAPTPAPVAFAPSSRDEAMELTRWTLGEMDEDDYGSSLASPSPAMDIPAAAPLEAPLAEAQDTRLEGARAFMDSRDHADDFADSMAEASPEATLAETIFASGLESEDDFTLAEQPSIEEPRAGAVRDVKEAAPAAIAPLENFFAAPSDAFASDIDRKIDEALELAERMRAPRKSQEGDELDVPAFLRNGMKDLPLE